jgi:hypothetical protein
MSLLVTSFCIAASAQADVVTDWNNHLLNAIRTNRTTPPMASRQLATLHASIYDAVNGITRTHETYRVRGNVPASALTEAAAAAAAHRVMVTYYPAASATYDAAYQATLAGLGNSPNVRKGVAWGEQVAQGILAWRATDGWNAVVTPLPAAGPGDWVPTPPAFAPYLLPQWGFVACFAMTHSAQFRPPGPPALNSEAYAIACNEVKAYGAATNSIRTPDQSQIAQFWADGAGTETPPGHWNSIAQDVGAALRNTMEENARLFALLNIAMADAAICAWDAKYTFHNWRPVTAIRNADQDGNPATSPDPGWSSFIGTPPFPDYVSGHSTFSGSASTVLALFYGTDNISFTTGSDFLPGVLRSFTRFSAASEEAMNSRMYGGIHYRFANEDGLASGQDIGAWTFTHYLQPKGNRSRQ